jgi:hypothetical protein
MPVSAKICPQCGHANDVGFPLCGQCGAPLPEQTVSDVVSMWFDGEQTMYDAVHDSPEVAWPAILQILDRALTEDQLSVLAAGPLEDLLAMHGPEFIDRIEHEAEQNPRFNHLLGGVWQNEMSPEIWERVQKARKEVW